MRILSIEEMRVLEDAAFESGISYESMMQHAGRNLAKWLISSFEMSSNKLALGLIGSGKNGSDTLIALNYLLKHGWQCLAYLAKKRSSEDNYLLNFTHLGGGLITDIKQIEGILHYQPLLLDGFLGTGFSSPMENMLSVQIHEINQVLKSLPIKPVIIAVDCPSGIDSDRGSVDNPVIAADFTACMGAAKQGLLKFPAFEYCGELKLIKIGLLKEKTSQNFDKFCVDDEYIKVNLPKRGMNSHKGTYGRCAIAAGSSRYPGAAYLAGKAAYLSGAGLVSIISTTEVQKNIAGQLPELTWMRLDSKTDFQRELASYTSLLIGPGLGADQSAKRRFMQLWQLINLQAKQFSGQLIFDADGLRILHKIADWPDKLSVNTILTPHPGEMACLTGLSIETIQSNRWDIAKEFAKKWQKVVVLKGALTIIANPLGLMGVIPFATSALATAGTGDILSGMIAGFCAQGIEPFIASVLSSYIHSSAGLKAEKLSGQTYTITASEVLSCLPGVLAE